MIRTKHIKIIIADMGVRTKIFNLKVEFLCSYSHIGYNFDVFGSYHISIENSIILLSNNIQFNNNAFETINAIGSQRKLVKVNFENFYCYCQASNLQNSP